MWFKLASATFTNNLGTMSELSNSWPVSYNLSGGISKNSCPSSVAKNSAGTQAAANFTATFTLASGSTLNHIKAFVGGTQVGTTVTSGNSITIPAASITGPMTIEASATGASTGGGTDTPVTPPSGSTPTVTWTTGASLDAGEGKEITSTSRSRTNTIQVSDLTGSITSGGTATQFLIACYSGTTYLGQINATNNSGDLVKGSGQWINKGTLISKELLESKGATIIRMVVNSGSSGSTFIMNGTVLATTSSSSGSDSGSTTVTLDYPFVAGTITKETGGNTGGSRARTDKYFTADELGTSFTITECRFIVACYTSDDKYLGQRSTTSNTSSADCLTTAQWLTAGTEIATAELFGSTAYILENRAVTETQGTVEKVRFVAETPNTIPHLYIDGVKLTQ